MRARKLQLGGNPAIAMPSSALHLRPEIDLVNPSTSTSNNAGNITVASNWNFGAGSVDASGNINLLYRTSNGGEPGSLVLRAANNVKINATITDGFFAPYQPVAIDANSAYQLELASSTYRAYENMFGPNGLVYSGTAWGVLLGSGPPNTSTSANVSFFNSLVPGFEYTTSDALFQSLQFHLQAPIVMSGDPRIVDQYNQFYVQYVNDVRRICDRDRCDQHDRRNGSFAWRATRPWRLFLLHGCGECVERRWRGCSVAARDPGGAERGKSLSLLQHQVGCTARKRQRLRIPMAELFLQRD